MSEFTWLFRGRDMSMSPEQRQKHTEKWMAWFKELGAKGVIKEQGNPLEDAGAVVQGRDKVVTDGPFAEAKDIVGGYTVIVARDLAEAAELAKGCPILEVGGSVEVRPVQRM
ncbi:MAG TPA: YciI family protein [Candidatus Xenobia bacterium]